MSIVIAFTNIIRQALSNSGVAINVIQYCKVRFHILVETNKVLKLFNVYSHGSDAAIIEVAKVRAAVKHQAEESQETPSTITHMRNCI